MDKLLVQQLMEGISLKKVAEDFCSGNYKKAMELIKTYINEGFNICKKVTEDGDIIFTVTTGYKLYNNEKVKTEEIVTKSNEVKTLIISDLHIGQLNDGLLYISKVYAYAKAHNINIIFMAGDLFDGITVENSNKYKQLEGHISRFLNYYPYDPSIVNFMLFGNHDLITMKSMGFDYSKLIEQRLDIINLGYGLGRVKLGNDYLAFSHELLIEQQPDIENYAKYLFKGHSHKFEITGSTITVPALLDTNFYDNIISLGFLEADFMLDDNQKIKSCRLKHLSFDNDLELVNEVYVSDENIKIKKKI